MQCLRLLGPGSWPAPLALSGTLSQALQAAVGPRQCWSSQCRDFASSSSSSSSSSQSQGGTQAATGKPAPSAASEPSGSSRTAQPGQQQQQQAGAPASSSSSSSRLTSGLSGAAPPPGPAAAAAAAPAEPYYRSRLYEFYKTQLARELLLKLNVRHVHQLPRIRKVVAHINASDLYPEREFVDKWQMLLPALALEYITGQPVEFHKSSQKYYRAKNVVAGVQVKLFGDAAYDFLEKVNTLVLPSQNAFDGILLKQLDAAGSLHFRIPKMINFPDFEEMFETFEALSSLHVTVVMENVSKRPVRSQLLLTGLQVPLLRRRKVVGQPDEAFSSPAEEKPAQQGTQGAV